ncbi:hypothetical protein ACQ4M3_12855 [Leptolyngbya sp. AN03gr2]|uniref:hypothetical protein n=1 Tax=unclassified Leptolyngbya TaxID=2650499 RepID=UPI003D31F6C6
MSYQAVNSKLQIIDPRILLLQATELQQDAIRTELKHKSQNGRQDVEQALYCADCVTDLRLKTIEEFAQYLEDSTLRVAYRNSFEKTPHFFHIHQSSQKKLYCSTYRAENELIGVWQSTIAISLQQRGFETDAIVGSNRVSGTHPQTHRKVIYLLKTKYQNRDTLIQECDLYRKQGFDQVYLNFGHPKKDRFNANPPGGENFWVHQARHWLLKNSWVQIACISGGLKDALRIDSISPTMIPDQKIKDPERRCDFFQRLQEANRRYWQQIYAGRIYFGLLIQIQHPIFTWVICLCCRKILDPTNIQSAYYQERNRIAAKLRTKKLEQKRQQQEEQNRVAAELRKAELEQERQRRETQRLAAEAAIKQKIEWLRHSYLSRLFMTQRSNHFLSVKEVEIVQLNGEIKIQSLIDQHGQRHPVSTVYWVETEKLPRDYVLVRVNESLAIAIEKRWHLYRDVYVQMLTLDSGVCMIGRMTRVSVKDVHAL